jgi:pyridoxal/pyridoxine/pyridoxamine kinase
MTIITNPVTATEMATAMAALGTTTDQVAITARAVMGDTGHMMVVIVVIAEEVIMVKAMEIIAPNKVEVMEDMVVMVFRIMVIRVDGGECAVIFLTYR